MFNYPLLFFPLSICVLWLSAQIGAPWPKGRSLSEDERADFGFVQAATLIPLGLIIGFSFLNGDRAFFKRIGFDHRSHGRQFGKTQCILGVRWYFPQTIITDFQP
jgi:hypothetical protein